jgi:MoxR-like ATPase
MPPSLAIPSASREQLVRAHRTGTELQSAIGQVIHGKPAETGLALACLLAGGHLLIEDVPGVGKTLLARALAQALGLSFRRIQFTSDLLPADIIGMTVFEQAESRFRFHPGPVFAQVVLADEVNRATPKAQSALLEAMEEHQVTVDGETYPLPDPFFVIATQNPEQQVGTYPLPESQLDRFLMRISLGYPPEALERRLLKGEDRHALLAGLAPVIGPEELRELQAAARLVFVADPLLDYVQALVRHTRQPGLFELGLSPRGARDLVAAARCHALLQGHAGVRPDDVKAVFVAVAGHRLRPRHGTAGSASVARQVLETVPVT